jgi:hypothetical protein
MSLSAAPRCSHIKANGTHCGSPALHSKKFCFYHQNNRPIAIETYSDKTHSFSEVFDLPAFEDAHSIQSVIREVIKLVLIDKVDQKAASLSLYALQIASSNLKRIELERPQPEQVVTDIEKDEKTELPIAVGETSLSAPRKPQTPALTHSAETGEYIEHSEGDELLPPGTIHAYGVKFTAKSRRHGQEPRLQ